MAKNEEKQQGGEPQSQAPSLSHREALTADFGNGRQQEAQKKGYDGYVWQEDKSEYTVAEVVNNDQSGPNKSVHDDHDFTNDHWIRPDKMNLDKK